MPNLESGKTEKPRTPNKNVPAKAFLCGPVRIIPESGDTIIPRGALRQAILAVLLLSPEQMRARKTLQVMFWGASSREKSSHNLRQRLVEIRRDLAPLGDDCIGSDRHSIWIAPGRISVAKNSIGPSFLEGIDLSWLPDCEGFEDWLREKRNEGDNDVLFCAKDDAPISRRNRAERFALGLLAPQRAGLRANDGTRVESIVDAIARFVGQMTDVEIHDFRGSANSSFPLPIDSGFGATHLLQAVAERRGRKLAMHFRLFEATNRRVVWISEPIDALSDQRDELVCSTSEQLLQQVAACPAAGDPTDLFPWTALTGLFSFDDDLIAKTEAKVAAMATENRLPVFDCLRIFAQIFKANEGLARADAINADEICEVLSALPDTHPQLPLSLSLAGYSAHMLAGENELAEMLVLRARDLAPNLALNLDHLAVIRLMRGDIDGAEKALRQCLRTGASSPWRYTYHVSGAMISMARGDVRQALLFANQALMLKPRFIGALRYAMLGFALSDNAHDARRMKFRIKKLRPDYDFEGWANGMIRRSSPHFGGRLAQGLQTTGII